MVSELTSKLTGPDKTVFSQQALSRDLPSADILALDRLAVAAWAAPENEDHNGWLFRHAAGVSRRANSVAPFPLSEDIPLDDLLAQVEAYYRARGLPPRLQISPAACPPGLDDLLAERGYEIESGVTIMICEADKLAQAESTHNVTITETAPPGWWDLYIEGYQRDARDIAARAQELPVFAAITTEDGRTDAIGLGVAGGNWLAVFGMFTRPDCRSRGLGAAIIRALAGFTVARNGIGLYLQVEYENLLARRLYENLGFRDVYGYHYRTLWTAT